MNVLPHNLYSQFSIIKQCSLDSIYPRYPESFILLTQAGNNNLSNCIRQITTHMLTHTGSDSSYVCRLQTFHDPQVYRILYRSSHHQLASGFSVSAYSLVRYSSESWRQFPCASCIRCHVSYYWVFSFQCTFEESLKLSLITKFN